jgi:hypothetical protein
MPQKVLVPRRESRDPQIRDAVRQVVLCMCSFATLELGVLRQGNEPRLRRIAELADRRARVGSSSHARSSSWPSTCATLSGHRANRSAVSRSSNACTGSQALNQTTPSATGTRSTVAHGRSRIVSMTPTVSNASGPSLLLLLDPCSHYAPCRE